MFHRIIVTPKRARFTGSRRLRVASGVYDVRLEGHAEILLSTTEPFTDAARELLRRGIAYLSDRYTMRHEGAAYDAMRETTVGAAAKRTVEERDDRPIRFVKHKDYTAEVAARIDGKDVGASEGAPEPERAPCSDLRHLSGQPASPSRRRGDNQGRAKKPAQMGQAA
jgi:hypothetical protein